MNLKTSLFNKIKDFIYSPNLTDINVYSKPYLNSVIKPYFSSDKSNYGSICIDFNKLNDINTRYGFETGDKVIYYTLYLIKSVLLHPGYVLSGIFRSRALQSSSSRFQ